MSVSEVSTPGTADVIELPVAHGAHAAPAPPVSLPAPRVPAGTSPAQERPERPCPRWPAYVLVACGIALVPWLVVLATTLPATATAPHWMAAWVGLDTMEAAGLVTTGVLTLRRHPLRVVAAAATAMLLVVDAWFDVATSTGGDLTVALIMAGTAELPLAAVCALLAVRSSTSVARVSGATAVEERAGDRR
ncbi:hypothetical protein [Actinacidiphila acidipaludis]|uniref:Uncharacterized protein n=1 Tax=Actinacidiphila acidipaludis TaxID=2873382 RepID=A0ABS7Q446_9ACTN|nr:hypothetical protein [Streptomyces acidipaludis]MBY8877728.1 hypothetical protein [Streptomyces acidipaludis]